MMIDIRRTRKRCWPVTGFELKNISPPPEFTSVKFIGFRTLIEMDTFGIDLRGIMEKVPHPFFQDLGIARDSAKNDGPFRAFAGVLAAELQNHRTVLSHALLHGPTGLVIGDEQHLLLRQAQQEGVFAV